jgi:hypothetical protein
MNCGGDEFPRCLGHQTQKKELSPLPADPPSPIGEAKVNLIVLPVSAAAASLMAQESVLLLG